MVQWRLLSLAGFLLYFLVASALILFLIFYIGPSQGPHSVLVYIGICSLVGSLSVMSVKVSLCISGRLSGCDPHRHKAGLRCPRWRIQKPACRLWALH